MISINNHADGSTPAPGTVQNGLSSISHYNGSNFRASSALSTISVLFSSQNFSPNSFTLCLSCLDAEGVWHWSTAALAFAGGSSRRLLVSTLLRGKVIIRLLLGLGVTQALTPSQPADSGLCSRRFFSTIFDTVPSSVRVLKCIRVDLLMFCIVFQRRTCEGPGRCPWLGACWR